MCLIKSFGFTVDSGVTMATSEVSPSEAYLVWTQHWGFVATGDQKYTSTVEISEYNAGSEFIKWVDGGGDHGTRKFQGLPSFTALPFCEIFLERERDREGAKSLTEGLKTRMHSSRMRIASSSIHRGACVPNGGVCPRGPACPGGVCTWGGVCARGACMARRVCVALTPLCEQNDWQTGVKTLPCRNFVAGSNNVNCLRNEKHRKIWRHKWKSN